MAAIERGNLAEGHDILDALGWIQNTDDDKHLVDAYMGALATKRPGQADRDRALVLAPTHADPVRGVLCRRRREAAKVATSASRQGAVTVPSGRPAAP